MTRSMDRVPGRWAANRGSDPASLALERTHLVKTLARLLILSGLSLLALPGNPLQAGGRDVAIMEDATEVLDGLATLPIRHIPPALLHDAQGLAIIPGLIKAGFVIGGRHGRGVLVARTPDGAWGRPEFITLSGASIGWQIGVQSTDVVLIFKTRRGLDRIRNGKLTLGADVAVAAGPVGRQAEAATDAMLAAEIYSYSRSRGLFAGLSLEGGVLLLDPGATAAYYRQEPAGYIDPRTNQLVPVTPPSVKLQAKLAQLTAVPVPPPGAVILAPAPVTVAPPPPPPPLLPASPVPVPRP
jgi:lipid-binding SYLF domain-containing protein